MSKSYSFGLLLGVLISIHPLIPLRGDEITPSCSKVEADQELAQRFFPEVLLTEFADIVGTDVAPSRAVCATRADLDGTGRQDFLVAAYSNGISGVVRVISRTSTPSVVAQDERNPKMGAEMPFLSLVDIEGDGRPEIFVAYHTRHNVAGWLLKWSDRRLRQIGPLVADEACGEKLTQVEVPALEDVDGDGILELLQDTATRNNPSPTPAVRVFALSAGGFAESGLYAWWGVYTRQAGAPSEFKDNFRRPAEGEYVLRVVNGDRSAKAKVGSGTITLNGKEVVGPADFKRSERVFTVPVTLLESNELRVALQGTPGAELTLTVLKPKQ